MIESWKYTKDYKIRSESPTIPSLCRIMEEAAGEHAKVLDLSIERLLNQGIAWVLAKMQIEIFNSPELGDTVTLHTWPVAVSRLQFRRDFELYSSSGEMLARALTQWVIVNLTTRKVERVPKFVSDVHPDNPSYALKESDWKFDAQTDSPALANFNVQASDIDINNHVNNVRYVDWITESMPAEYRRASMVEIVFRAEAVDGDSIVAKGKIEEDGRFHISLFREGDNVELIRARCAKRA